MTRNFLQRTTARKFFTDTNALCTYNNQLLDYELLAFCLYFVRSSNNVHFLENYLSSQMIQ